MKIKSVKKKKKGFTLAELVVVIGILSIIAAIAIPGIITIINSASKSESENRADELNKACKEYYTLVISGSINSTNRGSSTQTTLPTAVASTSRRRVAAKSATVINACEYAEITSIKDDINSGSNSFVYDSDGTIYAAESRQDLTSYVTPTLTLGTLYY